MSERKQLILMTTIGAVSIQYKDDFRVLGIFFLGISFILAIMNILNIVEANYLFKDLLRNILIIEDMMKMNVALLFMIRSHIFMAKEDIKYLKKSKQYLSEEQYVIVLNLEKRLSDIENQKTGRL